MKMPSIFLKEKKENDFFLQKRSDCEFAEKTFSEDYQNKTNNTTESKLIIGENFFGKANEKNYTKSEVVNMLQLICELPSENKKEVILGVKNGIDISIFAKPILTKTSSVEGKSLQLIYRYLPADIMKAIRVALEKGINIMPIYDCDKLVPPNQFKLDEVELFIKAIENGVDIFSSDYMTVDDYSRKSFDTDKIKLAISKRERISDFCYKRNGTGANGESYESGNMEDCDFVDEDGTFE